MRKIYHAVMAALLLSSCNHYLDVKPYGRTIPKTAEEFASLIHYHLNEIDEGSSNYLISTAGQNIDYDTGAGDDFETCLTEQSGRSLPIYVGSLLGSASTGAYADLYATIRDCNIVIDNMEQSGTEEETEVRAAAYAMRGVSYYNLLRLYCAAPDKGSFDAQPGMPLVTQFDMEERPVRSSMQQTIDRIESDLKQSISYKATNSIFRFTEDVTKAYLARLYFWTEQWDKALPLLTELLATHPLLQGEAYAAMVKTPLGKTNNHLIKAYTSYSSSSNQEYNSVSKLIAYRPVSRRFLSLFAGEEATDARYALYVNRKRKAVKPLFCGLRAAELKLMQAECRYHLGDNAAALQALNDLRQCRISNYTPYTMETLPAINTYEIIVQDAEGKPLTRLMAAILAERRKELFLEGDRFFEQKRNGTPEYWTAYNGRKYVTRKYMYTYPIPESEIRINAAIVQNEGYTELESN